MDTYNCVNCGKEFGIPSGFSGIAVCPFCGERNLISKGLKILPCPNCEAKLRFPDIENTKVKCPICDNEFIFTTDEGHRKLLNLKDATNRYITLNLIYFFVFLILSLLMRGICASLYFPFIIGLNLYIYATNGKYRRKPEEIIGVDLEREKKRKRDEIRQRIQDLHPLIKISIYVAGIDGRINLQEKDFIYENLLKSNKFVEFFSDKYYIFSEIINYINEDAKLFQLCSIPPESIEQYFRYFSDKLVFMEYLQFLCLADSNFTYEELSLLEDIAKKLGIKTNDDYSQEKTYQQEEPYSKSQYSRRSVGKEVEEAFAVMGLSKNSTWEEVKTAYRKLVKEYHPDRFQQDEYIRKHKEEMFKKIQAAYEILKRHFGK